MRTFTGSQNLLTSIAVFAELCDNEKDVQGILAEFIKSVFAFEKVWALDSSEMTLLLKKHFDFDLPEAVVRTCLNSLTKNRFTVKKAGKFVVVNESYSVKSIIDKLDDKKNKQELFEKELLDYCATTLQRQISSEERKEIIECFISYLVDTSVAENYSTLISSFVLAKSTQDNFISDLNQIKEGLVLLTGLTYTTDLNAIGYWKDELNIYLDTEHLFNAEGYNGDVFKKLFDDFLSLVNEINTVSFKRSQKRRINLKYFEETKQEIDGFFYVAEKIVKREANLSPDNIAMETICRGCISISDVLRKKSDFEANLKTRGIFVQEELPYYGKPEYNIEDAQLVNKYKDRYAEQEIEGILRSFTKINYHRRGQNRTSFEQCGHIILTGKIISLILSKDLEIKSEAKEIPFATDIYFATNRIWYRLNKGFSKSAVLPATLDVVTKAQIVLSSQLNRSVHKQYENLKSQLKDGNINTETAENWYHHLREKARKPEEISFENVHDSVDFIFENSFDRYLTEKSVLEYKIREGNAAIRKLNRIESLRIKKKKRIPKAKATAAYLACMIFFYAVLAFIPFGVVLLITYYKSPQDTTLSIVAFVITLIIELIAAAKLILPISRTLKRWHYGYYKATIRKARF